MTEALFYNDPYATECEARIRRLGDDHLVLDRTVFYPTGGGQPGDTGELVSASGARLSVTGTVRDKHDGEILHILAGGISGLSAGDAVSLRIDWSRRYRLMRFHSALHLLCAVVAAPVTGGRIGEDKAHLDFDTDMEKLDAGHIEQRLAELVGADLPVSVGSISDAELDADPSLVKTLSVQPPRGQGSVRTVGIVGVDLQPCGGTHVRHTGEIGRLKVSRIRNEGRRNKRVTLIFGD